LAVAPPIPLSTTVIGGCHSASQGMSSWQTSDSSSGTRTPRLTSVGSIPNTASWLAAYRAVIGSAASSSEFTARAPNSVVNGTGQATTNAGARIGLITPYFPVAHQHLAEFFAEFDREIVRSAHLSCTSPVQIGHTTEQQLIGAMRQVNGDEVDAIVQFGANLPMAGLAAEGERWLGKPVIAVNVATYSNALRSAGITDQVQGFGRLLSAL
jgi:maleate cis-trans isomerase